jgi:hypothetical protein
MQKFIITILSFCISLTGFSQIITEQIHIHFDKQIYLPGESIYFKTYLLYNNQPSFLSTNFYIATYTSDGKLLQQKQYPIFDGICNGDFSLPDTIQSNTIRVRAFTKGLQLVDSTNFYEHVLYVQTKTAPVLKTKDSKTAMQFFVEGGNAIADLQNIVAIKAIDENDNPIQVKGAIFEDGSNKWLDSFYTNKQGLATIKLIPQSGKSYYAICMNKVNQEQKTNIPIVASYGVLFHLEQINNILYFNVLKNIDSDRLNTLSLTVNSNAMEVYSAKAVFKNSNQWVSKMNLDSLPEGVLLFRLLDAENNILQSRLFLNRQLTKQPTINIVQKSINAKGENVVEIQINDSLLYNLSVAIADINFADYSNTKNIKEDIWITKNMLPHAKVTKLVLQDENNYMQNILMLTAFNNIYPKKQKNFTEPLDNFIALQGFYKNKNYAIPQRNNLVLIIYDSFAGKQFYKLKPKSQVDFIEEGLIFYDSSKINYQLDNNKAETEHITLNIFNKYLFASQISKYEHIKSNTDVADDKDNISDSIITNFLIHKPQKFNEVQTIKEVVVKSNFKNLEHKRIVELDEKYTSGMFSGLARGYQFNLLDDKSAWSQSDILNYIAYRVGSVKICNLSYYKILVSTRNISMNPCNKESMIRVFVNESELPDQEGLDLIPVSQIAYVKFISGIVIGSSFIASNGALYVYTKKGDEVDADKSTGMRKIKLKGYDVSQIFTSPDYGDRKNLLNADYRTTLYWNPYIVLDKQNSKAKIVFSNNDISKKLLLTIEGFNEEGKLIHIEKIIE